MELSDNLFDTNLSITKYNDATILPTTDMLFNGGVIDCQGRFVVSSAWNNEFDVSRNKYDFNTQDVDIRHETVIFLGISCKIWGHALVDNFKKCWFLFDPQCKELVSKYKIVYTTAPNEPLPSYIFELFKLANVNLSEFERITKITRFDNVYIPDNSIVTLPNKKKLHPSFPILIKNIIHNSKNYDGPVWNKIYFTRTHLPKNRHDYGERSIEKLFRKKGFAIIAPEEHSVIEQIHMLQNCKVFAATEGSISHSSIFCSPQCEIIILPKGVYHNPYTEMINSILPNTITSINIGHSIYCHKTDLWRSPFYMYPTKELKRFLGFIPLTLPYQLRPSFWYYCWHHSRIGIKMSLAIYYFRRR